jgi:outer membrane protein assembly factor BamB
MVDRFTADQYSPKRSKNRGRARAVATMTALATAAAVALPASADQQAAWPSYNGDPQNTMRAQVSGPEDPGLKWHVDLAEVETSFAPEGYAGSYNLSRPLVAPDGTLVLAAKNADPQYENRARFGREVIGLDPDDGSVLWEIPNTSVDHDRCSPGLDAQGRLWMTKVPPRFSDAELKLGAFDPATGAAIGGTEIVIEDLTKCNRTNIHVGGEGDLERAVLFGQGGDPSELVAFDISGDSPSVAFAGVAGVDEIAGVPGTGSYAEHVAAFSDDSLIVAARTGEDEGAVLELLRLSLEDGEILDRTEVPTPGAEVSSGDYDRVRMMVVDDRLITTPRTPRGDTEQGLVAALALDGLTELWSVPMPAGEPHDLALGDGHVYVQPGSRTTLGGPATVALDVDSGAVAWEGYEAGERPVTDVDGNAYTTGRHGDMTRDSLLASYDADGEVRWVVEPDAIVEAAGVASRDDLNLGNRMAQLLPAPIDAEGTLYVLSGAGSEHGILAIDDSGGLAYEPEPEPEPEPVRENPFPDVPDDNVHLENIIELAERGITAGDADGNYNPRGTVSRAQFATFLARAFGLTPIDGDHFRDVPSDSVHAGNIYAVAEAGITQGTSATTFDPSGTLTREQMASMLARAFGLAPVDGDHFRDVHPDSVHAGNIYAVAEAGITQGTSANTFDPDGTLRRDQMASLLIRGLDSQEG